MRKNYPYLQNPYLETITETEKKQTILADIDNFYNQKQYVNITLLNWDEDPIKEISGELTSGTITKDGSSPVRRTCSFSASLGYGEYSIDDLTQDFAINKKVFIEIGIKNYSKHYPEYPIFWFPQGVFFVSSCSITNNATSTVGISLSLKDKMAGLNGDVGGKFVSTVQLDEMITQENGKEITKKVKIFDIIQELVNHFGKEPLNNIIIQDIDLRIKRVEKWIGENPIYIHKSEKNNEGVKVEEELSFLDPKDQEKIRNPENYNKYLSEQDIGYVLDDFVLDSELTMNAGQNVTDALDKIKTTLGNYEYFYDEFGVFHFQEIKNYINTSQTSVLLKDMSEKNYYLDISPGKAVYTFSDSVNIISLSVNPKYENIKNDFVVQGQRKVTSTSSSFPIMYHFTIDKKPSTGNKYTKMILYKDEETKDVVAAFPIEIKAKGSDGTPDSLPSIGNPNLVYRTTEIKKGQKITNQINYWCWSNGVYKKIVQNDGDFEEYYEEKKEKETTIKYYTSKDYRTDIYLQGKLAAVTGSAAYKYYFEEGSQSTSQQGDYIVSSSGEVLLHRYNNDIYYEELNAYWPQIYDLKTQKFKGEADGSIATLCDKPYFLEIADEGSSQYGEFSINNIGRRTQVTVDNDINCLFEPKVPDFIFVDIDDPTKDAQIGEIEALGYIPVQVSGNVMKGMATGGWRNPAFEQIKYDMYLHLNYQKTISVTAIPVFYLEPNVLIDISDKSTNTFGNYTINNISISLGTGNTMTVTANETFSRN